METNPNASVYEVLTEIKNYFAKEHKNFIITQTKNRLIIENHLANYKKTRNRQGELLAGHHRVLAHTYDTTIKTLLFHFSNSINILTKCTASVENPGNILYVHKDVEEMYDEIVLKSESVKKNEPKKEKSKIRVGKLLNFRITKYKE